MKEKKDFDTKRAILARDVAAQPGYVRLVLPVHAAHARSACRRFSSLCREEAASRGLILAPSSDWTREELEKHIGLATREMTLGFRLAVVVQGSAAASVSEIATSVAARRKARTKIFWSEHHAAAWLMS
jgi:hypothetical protein